MLKSHFFIQSWADGREVGRRGGGQRFPASADMPSCSVRAPRLANPPACDSNPAPPPGLSSRFNSNT